MLVLCSGAAGCSGDDGGANANGGGGGGGGGRLLFAPQLSVLPGALASTAPPVGVLARVLGWAHGALRAADARHAQVGLTLVITIALTLTLTPALTLSPA
jgi:hypothetical protein